MKWFWQRRKEQPAAVSALAGNTSHAGVSASVARAPDTTGRLGTARSSHASHEPADALLRFARDVLLAQGGHVRVEDDDLVAATYADGTAVRYTTTLARARDEEGTQLLVEGGGALSTLLDACAEASRLSALRLAPAGDPVALALSIADGPALGCGRCVGCGGEPWLVGEPTCAVCPLREGGAVWRFDAKPVGAAVTQQFERWAVELTYLLVHRDRRGRADEWLRLSFDCDTARRCEPLTPAQLRVAQAVVLPEQETGLLSAAAECGRAALHPAQEAAAAFLRQRVSGEHRQRVEDVATTYARLRSEAEPADVGAIEAALAREVDALAEVFAVDVEARLESVCLVAAPHATVAVTLPSGAVLPVTVDTGRSAVVPLACGACGEPASAGHCCDAGHLLCARCAVVCASCGRHRCVVCAAPELLACDLCADVVCVACAERCAMCERTFCEQHLWPCNGADAAVCITCAELCGECERVLCETHVMRCTTCGEVRCEEHTTACAECGTAFCAEHVVHCSECGRVLCADHRSACDACGAALCATDVFACAGCGRRLCACAAPTRCVSCQLTYCATCVGATSTCPGCRALAPAQDDDLTLLAQAAASDGDISLKRKWLAGRNARVTVFAARALGRQTIYVIGREGEIVASHRKGWR